MIYDIIVIGGGPAGLTAAIYARRAGKSVLVIEKSSFGGQITWSPKVENFPTHASISGAELGDLMLAQAEAQGAEIELDEALRVEELGETRRVICEYASYECRALIIAAGAKPRMLGLEREEELVGAGVCFCAVCDGAFYAGRKVAVAGGGNSALQDAMLLSEKCEKVYLIHRRGSFRGEAKLVEALREKENVEFLLSTRIEKLLGEEELSGLILRQEDGERELAVDGLFVAVGHAPDLGAFSGLLRLDEGGYADADESCQGAAPGVFVAGDCRKKKVRQVTTAVSDGSAAALAACEWLDAKK